ncbi:MAG: hypothetical protein H6P95_34 [Candidatus Aminicenantes bacterium]|nr:hypothetical protein [Candidatus Aminicenantes bacterium]
MAKRRITSSAAPFLTAFLLLLALFGGRGSASAKKPSIIVDHACTKIEKIPGEWIEKAKKTLHIAYGFTSHGSQLVTGMAGLVTWEKGGPQYSFNGGGKNGALDLRAFAGNFGNLGIAHDLNQDITFNMNRTAWEKATRKYLATNPGVNVVMWAWCYGANTSDANIDLYLDLMSGLERDFPDITFVYQTGRTSGPGYGTRDAACNQRIRDYCRANGKVLYDFYDIECYDPDGTYYGDKLVNCMCDYDSDGDRVRDRNWAVEWQNAHPGEWYDCRSEHSHPLNANLKAYAAWWLWARLAGWDGR